MTTTLQTALNRAVRDAVDWVHAQGWDSPPHLFALVATHMLTEFTPDALDEEDQLAPLTPVAQEDIPEGIEGGSEELGRWLETLSWPSTVTGVILSQEIMFANSAPGADPTPRPARLTTGVLRTGEHLTVLQVRPTEEELAAKGPFAEDEIELLGGDGIAPGVTRVLAASLDSNLGGEAWENDENN